MDGWIDVNDRLPEDGRAVLAWVERERPCYHRIWAGISIAVWQSGRWYISPRNKDKVLYWAPIPKYPMKVRFIEQCMDCPEGEDRDCGMCDTQIAERRLLKTNDEVEWVRNG